VLGISKCEKQARNGRERTDLRAVLWVEFAQSIDGLTHGLHHVQVVGVAAEKSGNNNNTDMKQCVSVSARVGERTALARTKATKLQNGLMHRLEKHDNRSPAKLGAYRPCATSVLKMVGSVATRVVAAENQWRRSASKRRLQSTTALKRLHKQNGD
jgi:hypothetical protein